LTVKIKRLHLLQLIPSSGIGFTLLQVLPLITFFGCDWKISATVHIDK